MAKTTPLRTPFTHGNVVGVWTNLLRLGTASGQPARLQVRPRLGDVRHECGELEAAVVLLTAVALGIFAVALALPADLEARDSNEFARYAARGRVARERTKEWESDR